eukprot:UN20976
MKAIEDLKQKLTLKTSEMEQVRYFQTFKSSTFSFVKWRKYRKGFRRRKWLNAVHFFFLLSIFSVRKSCIHPQSS